MGRFHGISAARVSILSVLRHPVAFARVAFFWSLVHAAILVGHAVYHSLATSTPLDIATDILFLHQPDQYRLAAALTTIPDALASLSVSIWWTRFLLNGALPRWWISVPNGSARYFSRELIIGFGAIVGIVPGFFLAGIVSGHFATDSQNFLGFAVIGLNAVVVAYGMARLWLVFPAIALGNSLSFSESFRLTRRAAGGLWLATITVYLAFLVPAVAIDLLSDYAPMLDHRLFIGWPSDVVAIGLTTISFLFVLAVAAAGAAVTALLYRDRVLQERPA